MIPVLASDLIDHWPIEGLAEVYEAAGYREGDILSDLATGRMQLWKGDKFAVITQIAVRPKFKTAVILFLAGHDMSEWFDDMLNKLETWAIGEGCAYLEAHGRRGWARIAPPEYSVYTTVRKALDGQELRHHNSSTG